MTAIEIAKLIREHYRHGNEDDHAMEIAKAILADPMLDERRIGKLVTACMLAEDAMQFASKSLQEPIAVALMDNAMKMLRTARGAA